MSVRENGSGAHLSHSFFLEDYELTEYVIRQGETAYESDGFDATTGAR